MKAAWIELLLPLVLAIVFFSLDENSGDIAIHRVDAKALPGNDISLSYPIFFGNVYVTSQGSIDSRVHCYAEDIVACKANTISTEPCCEPLRNKKKAGMQITDDQLIMYSVIPVFIMFVIGCAQRRVGPSTFSQQLRSKAGPEAFINFCGFALSLFLCLAVGQFFKNLVGAQRPNFYSLKALVDYDSDTYGKMGRDMYMNVPSLHSGMFMASFVYFSFYLYAKVQVFAKSSRACSADRKCAGLWLFGEMLFGAVPVQWALLLSCTPTFFAIWGAATRIQDCWHSPAAVCLGLLLGGVSAVYAWYAHTQPRLIALWAEGSENETYAKGEDAEVSSGSD